MVFNEILFYSAHWIPSTDEGFLFIQYLDGKKNPKVINIKVNSPQAMLTILDILRNEKPVYLNPTTNAIFTNLELVGEAE